MESHPSIINVTDNECINFYYTIGEYLDRMEELRDDPSGFTNLYYELMDKILYCFKYKTHENVKKIRISKKSINTLAGKLEELNLEPKITRDLLWKNWYSKTHNEILHYKIMLEINNPCIVKDPPKENCAICLEIFNLNTNRLPSCKHMFHEKCIKQWVKQSIEKKCPLCRSEISDF